MPKRPSFKHGIKRGRICPWPPSASPPAEIAARVTYKGNRIHKTYPSPAGDPALQADEAKSARYDARDWPKLLDALRQAIRAECTGEFRGSFPSRAWAWINDVLHEARLNEQEQGEYHGFPLDDPRQFPEPADLLERAPHVEIP